METNETLKPSVMSVGLKFGVMLGLISVVFSLVLYVAGINPMDYQWVTNSINLVFVVTIVAFAHKNFKDNGNGFMSYGQGLGIGVITAITSMVIAGVYTYLYFNYINPSAFEDIWEKAAADMEAKGQDEQAIKMGMEWGRKLFWPFFIIGGIFWGFIVALIVSIFTQKKEPETAF